MGVNDPVLAVVTDTGMSLEIVRGQISAFGPGNAPSKCKIWLSGKDRPFIVMETVATVRDFVEADPALTIGL